MDALCLVDCMAHHQPNALRFLRTMFAHERIDQAEAELRKDLEPAQVPGPIKGRRIESRPEQLDHPLDIMRAQRLTVGYVESVIRRIAPELQEPVPGQVVRGRRAR